MRRMMYTTKAMTLILLTIVATANTDSSLTNTNNKAGFDVSVVNVLNESKTDKKSIIQVLDEIQYKEDQEHQFSKNIFGEAKVENANNSSNGAWVKKNKSKIVNILLVFCGLTLFILICYKYYSINKSIKEQNAQIQSYADHLEKIIEGSDKLVFATWKDQKDGIQFIDNPAYKKKSGGDLTKTQRIQAEIEKTEEEIKKKSAEIDTLREKEIFYTEEIVKLEKELQNAKTLVFDEGAALGFAETVLREFK